MKLKTLALAATIVTAGLAAVVTTPSAYAQAAEQFIPLLVYRTGQFARNAKLPMTPPRAWNATSA
jgi:branched-chain amino acid transport system substrate-binding protein